MAWQLLKVGTRWRPESPAHGRARTFVVAMLAIAWATPSAAQTVDANGVPEDSITTSLPAGGDPGGGRARLAQRGITYSLMYTNDVLANVHGGMKRGAIDQGKVEATLAIDLDRLAGWKDMSFFANGFQIHNTGRIRRDYVGGINTIAAIEAVPTVRLSELWLERKLLDGRASLRFGQLAADTEFFFSSISTLLLQSDWATISALNLPSGGPAYPLATPGVRFKYEPNSSLSLLLAVFNGDPAGPGPGDEQLRNRYGLNFRVQDPPFVIGEVQAGRNRDKDDAGLATTLKLGGWAHFGRFDDQRFANDGGLLANPAGTGVALRHRGNSGVYVVLDQQIYRPTGGNAESGVSMFARASVSPSDRNAIGSYFDAGVVMAGMIPGRPDDKFGVGFIYAQYSDHVRNFDRDVQSFSSASAPARDFEANLELTYSAQIVPGMIVQPVASYVWHPSGDASRDAAVVGVRTFVRY